MATVIVKEPKMITFEFRQEKNDEDYGTCLWARFVLDLTNYTMFIESDCGNYGYGWHPTPDVEPFLKLCARFNKGYLIEKLSSRTVIDHDSTWKQLQDIIKEYTEYSTEIEDWDMDEIKDACYSERDERGVHDAIERELRWTNLKNIIDDYDIWDCIVKDYPAGAKKIEQVYITHIVPAIKEKLKGGVDNG